MKNGTRFEFVAAALAALLVAACGGGSGGSGGGDNGGGDPSGGIDRGGVTIVRGPINGFGSVVVNGVHYATSGATITIDDQPGAESDLRVGQVVRVEGTVDAGGTTGTARTIRFDDEVEGPVQSIDLANARLVVLGQTVLVGAGTSFDDSIVPRGLDGISVGDRVEVSGLVSSSGVIEATRIERTAATGPVEVKGTASAVDPAARTLFVNQLRISYATAQLDGFTGGQPAIGDRVEAVGTLDGGGVLVASRLEKHSSSLSGSSDDDADLEGLVTRFASATDFDVAGQAVTTTAATRYEGGSAADLALDVNVDVEGGFDSGGRIVAEEIEFRATSNVELAAPVEAVNTAQSSLTLLGVTVRTTPLTRFEDHGSLELQRFSLADLRVGDWVELRAYSDASGLVASLLDRDDADDGIEVRGPASAVTPPGLRIAGVSVTTDAQTEFRDSNGVSITAATFFAAAPGREVKVRGTQVGNTVLAERAEIED